MGSGLLFLSCGTSHALPVPELPLTHNRLVFACDCLSLWRNDALSIRQTKPSIGQEVTENNQYRDGIKESLFIGEDSKEPIARMENALQLLLAHKDLYAKIHDLRRHSFKELKKQMAMKVKKGELTQEEMDKLVMVERARWDAITVDEFTSDSMKNKSYPSITESLQNPMDADVGESLGLKGKHSSKTKDLQLGV